MTQPKRSTSGAMASPLLPNIKRWNGGRRAKALNFPLIKFESRSYKYRFGSNDIDTPDLLIRDAGQVVIVIECKATKLTFAAQFETQTTAGNGKLATSGLGSNSGAREALKIAFDYFKANLSRISAGVKASDHDYHLHLVDLQSTGATKAISLAGFVAFCSGVMEKPVQAQMVVLGEMSLGGSVKPVESLAECLQLAFDSGGKRILLPMSSVGDIPSVPGELFAKFQTSFYSDPVDAVFKALGVD